MLALERMHRIFWDGKTAFHPQWVSPIDTIPAVRSDFRAKNRLPLGPKIGSKMIGALFFAFQPYCNFLDDQASVLDNFQSVFASWHQRECFDLYGRRSDP